MESSDCVHYTVSQEGLCSCFVGAVGLKAATFEANPDAKRLYDDLLSNYNRLIRPVSNNTDTLTVWLGLKLSQLIEVVSAQTELAFTSISVSEYQQMFIISLVLPDSIILN
jgi:hypothetical protein